MSPDLEERVLRYFEDDLSDAEVYALQQELKADAEALALFVRFTRYQTLLIESISQEVMVCGNGIGRRHLKPVSKSSRLSRRKGFRALAVERRHAGRLLSIFIRRPAVVWLSAAACLVIVAFFFCISRQESATAAQSLAILTHAAPDAKLMRDGRWMAARQNTLLCGNDLFVAGSDFAGIRFPNEKILLDLGADTAIQLPAGISDMNFKVDKGRVKFLIAQRRPGQPVKVITPHAHTRVMGTLFSIQALDAHTLLDVLDGKVYFALPQRPDEGFVVTAGGSAVSDGLAIRMLKPAPMAKESQPKPQPQAPMRVVIHKQHERLMSYAGGPGGQLVDYLLGEDQKAPQGFLMQPGNIEIEAEWQVVDIPRGTGKDGKLASVFVGIAFDNEKYEKREQGANKRLSIERGKWYRSRAVVEIQRQQEGWQVVLTITGRMLGDESSESFYSCAYYFEEPAVISPLFVARNTHVRLREVLIKSNLEEIVRARIFDEKGAEVQRPQLYGGE